MDDLKLDDESVDTPLVSPFLDSNDDSDDGEVINEIEEYGNAGQLCLQRAINSFDGDDLAFQCMISFRTFVAYFDPFLPMNIITRKAYNTIMVKGLEALEWLLEELHMTWAQLEKKQTRPRLYTNYLKENQPMARDGVAGYKRRHQDYSKDGVDEDFSTWIDFRGNTCDLVSFGEETDKITDLHQIS
nr:hypothetical protein [Tanacetum cinerariifolium]